MSEAVGSGKKLTEGWLAAFIRGDIEMSVIEALLEATSSELEADLKALADERCQLAKVLGSIVVDAIKPTDKGEGKWPRPAIRRRTRKPSRKYST